VSDLLTLERPDLLAPSPGRLGVTERVAIRLVRRTFEPGNLDRTLRWCQRHIGANWIHLGIRHLLRVHGFDRLPSFDPKLSYICVANHRSFFDQYVVTGHLVRRGLPHRILFPVRSGFFYDHPLGLLVNGAASFFAMYPPIFRALDRAPRNAASLAEVVWLLRRGGAFVGFHPEGTRNRSDDPYALLPAKSGVGRIVHAARVPVLPVFVNGLGNGFVRQIRSNLTRTGDPIFLVFGAPIDFDDCYGQEGTPDLYRTIAERCLQAVAELGQEERQLRATLLATAKG
jgi:1-acyl-sn-glycerol-3-phosphate acyltransferase